MFLGCVFGLSFWGSGFRRQVRPVVEGSEMLVDPFNAGEMIDVETAEERLGPLFGKNAKVRKICVQI